MIVRCTAIVGRAGRASECMPCVQERDDHYRQRERQSMDAFRVQVDQTTPCCPEVERPAHPGQLDGITRAEVGVGRSPGHRYLLVDANAVRDFHRLISSVREAAIRR